MHACTTCRPAGGARARLARVVEALAEGGVHKHVDGRDRGRVRVSRALHGCDVGEGGLVGRARERAPEVLEVRRARRAADQEDAGHLHLRAG